MRFGLQLHGTLPLGAYGDLGTRAEALGFEDVTLHDLLMRRPVWPVLCDIARATTRVGVGPNVTHPFLVHPAMTAASVAHLDELSSGRAVLGIGRGSLYGLVGASPQQGLLAVEEAVQVIRLLTEGDRRPWQGAVFELGTGQGLKFGIRRRIPVQLGTFGPRGARLAGRIADGVRSAGQWDPSFMAEIRSWVRQGAEEAGRDPDTVALIAENWTCLHPDRERARRHARRILATFLPHLGPMLDFYRIPEEEVTAARAASIHDDEAALERISDATMDRFMAAGDADDLRRGLERLRDAGVDTVSFSGVLGPEPDLALEMIGAQMSGFMEGQA
jgi:5,10-methylenetetrahydromethanopterin reductase